ncbi:YfiR family protein [Acinetobacter equi]|nr:YfiR family protein [Acinetobacter equi]
MKSSSKLPFIILFSSALNLSTSIYANSTNTANTIYSILSYVKINTPSPMICTLNNPPLSDQLTKASNSYNKYRIKNVSISEIKKTNCNVIIFSGSTPKEEQFILNSHVTFPALSISTNNLHCEVGSAICLYKKKNQISFKINLESVNQSRVYIDPRILLLAKESEQ